jgi:hypothetical protein
LWCWGIQRRGLCRRRGGRLDRRCGEDTEVAVRGFAARAWADSRAWSAPRGDGCNLRQSMSVRRIGPTFQLFATADVE